MRAKRRVVTGNGRPAGAKRTPTVRRVRPAIVQATPRPRVASVAPSTVVAGSSPPDATDIDLSVDLGRGLVLPNPILVASGTFGYGVEYGDVVESIGSGRSAAKERRSSRASATRRRA